ISGAVEHLRRSLGLSEQQVVGTPLLELMHADTVSRLPDGPDRTLVLRRGGVPNGGGRVAAS
ncbi:MAG: hypothetical protein INR65_15335, partial [Gluconacetobacter diazotrophicus]|nr:hypothetical protein [Gluconacetobacter diazotrophicus]